MEKVRKRNRKWDQRCIIEMLEMRRLCSTTVTQGYPGFYQIDGDAQSTPIVVSVNQNASTFTLDGVTYGGVSYIVVNGHGSSDYIWVSGSPGPIGCTINADDGNNIISLNFAGGIFVGNGQNHLYLRDSFEGQVYTGTGNDYINVSGQCIDAVVKCGGGNDYVDCSQNLAGVVVYGGNGNDTICGSQYGDQIYLGDGSNVVYLNGGNNTVYANNGSPDTIYGGSGYDTVYANHKDSLYNVANVIYS